MAILRRAPLPNAPIGVEGTDLKGQPVVNVSEPYERYFRDQDNAINATAQPVAAPVNDPDRNTAQATTDLITPESSGLYSFQFYESVEAIDGGGATLITTLGWTERTIARTKVFTTLNGAVATNTVSDTYMIFADANAPITYANAYTSTTVGLFHYNFYAVLSSVAGTT